MELQSTYRRLPHDSAGVSVDKKKVLEVVILAVVIISVWITMFLPVVIYFLPLTDGGRPEGESSTSAWWNLKNLTCQRDKTNISLVCDDDFFFINGGSCKPKCSSWIMFSRSAETASLFIIGISTGIGILSTITIIVLSLTHFRKMLKFPSVLIIYQDVIVSIYGVAVIIGLVDRQLFCTSDDVIESYFSNASPFCTFTGVVSSYAVLPLALWIAVQISFILGAISAPFYFKRLREEKCKIHTLHVASLLVGIFAPLLHSVVILVTDGFSLIDTIFPPIVCFARNRDITVYLILIPLAVLISAIITQLLLIIHLLLKKRCERKNGSTLLQSAEVKMLIICCYYVILGLGASLAFAISSVYLNSLQRELQDYFECEGCGVDTNHICDRSHYEKFINPALITIGYSLFALYPVVTLIYIVQFSAIGSFIGKMCHWCRLNNFYSQYESKSYSAITVPFS